MDVGPERLDAGPDWGGLSAEAAGSTRVELSSVDLYWLPLGAGGHCVRINGRIFEALSARTPSGSARRG